MANASVDGAHIRPGRHTVSGCQATEALIADYPQVTGDGTTAAADRDRRADRTNELIASRAKPACQSSISKSPALAMDVL